jgi:hypothetical protein
MSHDAAAIVAGKETNSMEETENKRITPLVVGAAAAVMVVTLLTIGALTGITPLAALHRTQDARDVAAKPLETQQQPARPERDRSMALCATCGIVESIRSMQVDVQPDATSRADARAAKRTVYRVTVHMDDGSYRTISQPVEPGYSVGEKVRVIDSSIKTGG